MPRVRRADVPQQGGGAWKGGRCGMKHTDRKKRVCPRCGQAYRGRPAVSRKDNETQLCPDCGTREALEGIGVGAAEQEQILEAIHRCYGRGQEG